MSISTKSPEIRNIIRDLVQNGWVYKDGKKHGKLYTPDGKYMQPVTKTPSDPRAVSNFKAQIKRLLRNCEAEAQCVGS